jgi:hypothetical protein
MFYVISEENIATIKEFYGGDILNKTLDKLQPVECIIDTNYATYISTNTCNYMLSAEYAEKPIKIYIEKVGKK